MSKPIISVKEARKLLGSKYQSISDSEVEQMVMDIEKMSRAVIRDYLIRNTGVVK